MSKKREFIRYMSRHLVALTGKRINKRKKAATYFVYSGFVIKIRDEWFWATAGHCVKQLNRWISAKRIQLSHVCFADFFGPNATSSDQIPFELASESFSLDRKEYGLDFGLIHLTMECRKDLEVNGIEPITRKHWIEPNKFEFETFKMLGRPNHLVKMIQSNQSC